MNRKPRKDSKLHNLPPEYRARVDKWLFDKGLTYQQVADGCRKLFGLKISKSSVGRYYQGESMRRMGKERKTFNIRHSTLNTQSESAVHRSVRPTSTRSIEEASPEERWQELLARLTDRAMELTIYLSLEPDDETAREVAQIMRLLISARRERTDGMLAQLYRKRFEMWAAKEVYRYYVKTFKPKKKKPSNLEHRTVEPRIGSKAWLRNERFREEIQQMVDHAIESERLRQQARRQS